MGTLYQTASMGLSSEENRRMARYTQSGNPSRSSAGNSVKIEVIGVEMSKMDEPWGEFCTVFGATPRNRILEFFLEMRELDLAIGDVAEEIGLNKATTYNTVEVLIKEDFIVQTRKVGKVQLYKLNLQKSEVKVLIVAFNKVLNALGAKHNSEHYVEVEN